MPTNRRINLQPDQIIMGVLTPPIAHQKADLTAFYSKVNERYEYGSFALLNPGAQILSQDGNSINIHPNRIQIIEKVAQTFKATEEKIIEIIKTIYFGKFSEQMNPKVIVGYGIKLISRPEMGAQNTDANKFLSAQTKFGPDRLKMLVNDTQAKIVMGMRFNFRHSENGIEGQFDLRVEPWLQENKFLWVELDAQFQGGPSENVLATLEDRIELVKKFLVNNVQEFLEYWEN